MTKWLLRGVCVWFAATVIPAFAEEAGLGFVRDGQTRHLSLTQLRTAVPEVELDFVDPEYGKRKRYRGLPLAAVLRAGFGSDWKGEDYTEMVFTALDGYASVTTLDKLDEPGGHVVFADRDMPGWEPVGRAKANPGPFYLVWTGAKQTAVQEYPWPWQLAKIELVKFSSRYPEVTPRGVATDSAVRAGFLTFKGRCLRCHAMNQQGGKIGPDLNAPQSITTYRSPAMLKAFIHKPSAFRYTQMPDHTDLSERDLDNLLEYLRHMDRQRKSISTKD